jgi:hypothetical protein
MTRCEYCQEPITHPFRGGQRFCSRACSDQWFDLERKEAVAFYRAAGLRPTIEREEQRREAS